MIARQKAIISLSPLILALVIGGCSRKHVKDGSAPNRANSFGQNGRGIAGDRYGNQTNNLNSSPIASLATVALFPNAEANPAGTTRKIETRSVSNDRSDVAIYSTVSTIPPSTNGQSEIDMADTAMNSPGLYKTKYHIPLGNFIPRAVQVVDSNQLLLVTGDNISFLQPRSEVRLFSTSKFGCNLVAIFQADLGALSTDGSRLALAQIDKDKINLTIVSTPTSIPDGFQSQSATFGDPTSSQDAFGLSWRGDHDIVFARLNSNGWTETHFEDTRHVETPH